MYCLVNKGQTVVKSNIVLKKLAMIHWAIDFVAWTTSHENQIPYLKLLIKSDYKMYYKSCVYGVILKFTIVKMIAPKNVISINQTNQFIIFEFNL
jgi:hypothetical protein